MSSKRFLIVPILLLILLSIGFVSASDNGTDEIALIDESVSQPVDENSLNDEIDNDINSSSNMGVDESCPMSTKIESEDVTTYYKENSEFVSYLKDSNNQPISNKRVSILINSKIYDRTTDVEGKIVLKLNLKPGTYCTKVKFDGDDTKYIEAEINEYPDGKKINSDAKFRKAFKTDDAKVNNKSNCPLCAISNDNNAKRIWEFDEMEADHVTAWSKGGATDISNCQMLCKMHNQAKGNK